MARTRFIFVTGGVMSGIGKGVATSSIGRILQSKGYRVTAIKIDPYINVDAGTMTPTEHGEVFVTDDGLETDQDLGNYERFLDTNILSGNYMTTGRVYLSVINRERNLEYNGKNVEVVPDIPLEVIARIKKAAAATKADFVLIEIGGTVGEYQNVLFLEAARMLKTENPQDVLIFLVSYLPVPGKIGEMKTKPTQYAARSLNSVGIQPDFILCRSEVPVDEVRKNKIALFCSVPKDHVIASPDVDFIYEIPVNYDDEKLAEKILAAFKMKVKVKDLKEWRAEVERIRKIEKRVKIGIVGKYFNSGSFVLADSYISVIESVKQAAWSNGYKPQIEWISSEDFEKDPKSLKRLKEMDGVIIPGGFGSRGVEGKIATVKYLRENKIPLLGICYGMQIMCIEYARNVCGLQGANTTEVDARTAYPVIDIMPEQKINLKQKNFGATMRLGAYPAEIKAGTLAASAYREKEISERHRHRFEVNPEYVAVLEGKGLSFSGKSPSGKLMEIAELPPKAHPFFLGVQFHPEFKTRFMKPHPAFNAFMKASVKNKK